MRPVLLLCIVLEMVWCGVVWWMVPHPLSRWIGNAHLIIYLKENNFQFFKNVNKREKRHKTQLCGVRYFIFVLCNLFTPKVGVTVQFVAIMC